MADNNYNFKLFTDNCQITMILKQQFPTQSVYS